MANKTKKTFAERSAETWLTVFQTLGQKKVVELMLADEDEGAHYRFYINEKKETVVLLSEFGGREIVKPYHGAGAANDDKFDVYTGVMMALWKALTEVPTYKVHQLIAEIAPAECADAAATNLIIKLVEDVTGLKKEYILAEYAKAKETNPKNPCMEVSFFLKGNELLGLANTYFDSFSKQR